MKIPPTKKVQNDVKNMATSISYKPSYLMKIPLKAKEVYNYVNKQKMKKIMDGHPLLWICWIMKE